MDENKEDDENTALLAMEEGRAKEVMDRFKIRYIFPSKFGIILII